MVQLYCFKNVEIIEDNLFAFISLIKFLCLLYFKTYPQEVSKFLIKKMY